MSMLTGVVLQVLLEFGPLWLVALAAPAVLYGPHWAGLVSSLGLGGLIAGHIHLDRPHTAVTATALMLTASLILTTSRNIVVVTAAQILLALIIVAASIHVSRLLHDSVPSTIRAGVASGVSTLTWIAFLPIALGFGLLTEAHGVHSAGWIITASTTAAGALLIAMACDPSSPHHRGPGVPAPGC